MRKQVFLERLLFSASLTAFILIFMLFLGFPLFREGYLFTLLRTPWNPDHGLFGIYPMLTGTLSIVFLSLCWAFPLSLGASVLISVLAPPGFANFCKKTVQMLTGIPTVIYGFVGYFPSGSVYPGNVRVRVRHEHSVRFPYAFHGGFTDHDHHFYRCV